MGTPLRLTTTAASTTLCSPDGTRPARPLTVTRIRQRACCDT